VRITFQFKGYGCQVEQIGMVKISIIGFFKIAKKLLSCKPYCATMASAVLTSCQETNQCQQSNP
jgi:hypothetical protein